MRIKKLSNHFFIFGLGFLLFLAILGAAASSSIRSTIAYIDTNELWQAMSDSPEIIQRDSLLAIEQNQLQAYYNEMLLQFELLTNELSDTTRTLGEAILQEKITEWQDLQERLKRFEEQAQLQMEGNLHEFNKPIVNRMTAAVNRVAESNGYIYVFDSSFGNIVYSKYEADYILDEVLKELGY